MNGPLPAYRPLVFGLLSLVFALTGYAATQQLWTCGMHPQIIKTEPGNCPICGMKLTPIRSNAKNGAAQPVGERKVKFYRSTMNPGEVSPKPGKDSMGMDMVPVYDDASSGNSIEIDSVTVQKMNLKTGLVTRGPVRREIRSTGAVAYNEEALRDITTKYEGWIEKLFVNSTYARVKTGDPLFEIYSPDLYNAELNYVVARRGEGENEGPLTRAALGRLQLFDLSPDFIAELGKSGQVQRTFVYRAPADGVVVEKLAVVGQMIKAGERIYRIADLSSVWVLAQIYEQDLPFVRTGQPATVRLGYGNDRTFSGTVALVLPEVEEQTRAATARIALPNPDNVLRPGMYVDVRFEAQIADSAVLVPEIASLRSGDRNTVFIARDGGTFEPREVKLGARSAGGEYEVLSGLSEGERVVISGQFMLDSESQLREAIEKMTPASAEPTAGKAAGTGDDKVRAEPLGPSAPSSDQGGAPSSRALRSDQLRTLALATADAAAALGADNLSAYDDKRATVNTALSAYFAADPHAAHGPLARYDHGLAVAGDLKSARDNFEAFSTVVSDLAREAHLQHMAGLHVFECPMSPATGKARWLQRDAAIKNPFYGSAMPNCGDEIK